MFNSKKDRTKLKKEQRTGAPLITYFEPKSVMAEQFRTIRTNLEFAQAGKPLKTIAISSSIPMEGKSTISANLAYTMGQTGKNVLIVDADLRKPTLHRTFKLNNEEGLTTLLVNPELKFNQVVQKSSELNIYLLPAGPTPPNPAELIGSSQMGQLMIELAENFDLILYDTPPVTSVTDAQIIAHKADGILMVVRENYTRKDQLRKAKQALVNVNANILGFVMNDVSIGENDGYYAYYGSDAED